MVEQRPIYSTFSTRKRFWNRVDSSKRWFFGLLAVIILSLSPTIAQGNRNRKAIEANDDWIKAVIKNRDTENLEYLDEEEPPVPLPILTPLEKFRKEFNEKRKAQERRFW